LLALVPVTAALVLFASGLAMALSAAMVYFRDTEFLLGIALNAWFFLTPIVYYWQLVEQHGYTLYFRANPILPFITAYQQGIYEHRVPELHDVIEAVLIGCVTFILCSTAFARVEGRLAEEL
jgi:ABC-type polysaccharide/polyol phosphate export permease